LEIIRAGVLTTNFSNQVLAVVHAVGGGNRHCLSLAVNATKRAGKIVTMACNAAAGCWLGMMSQHSIGSRIGVCECMINTLIDVGSMSYKWLFDV
jgi:hypothetical protein